MTETGDRARVSPLQALAGTLRGEGGLLADTVVEPPDAPPGDERAFIVEAIREGYLEHYGTGRVVQPDDPDVALLAGDRLYALGLERLAALGDLAAVAELADIISLSAQAHAEGDPARATAVWQAGATALREGPTPDHEAAKRRWRGA